MPKLDQEVIIFSDGRAHAGRLGASLDLIDDFLDDDVLREIFLYFPAQAHWKDEYSQEDSTWLSITHTCRRWRTLSLTTPTIWSTIITSPSFWTPLCLERSQSAPIDIRLQWSSFLIRWNPSDWNPSDELVATMLRHLNHTRTLILENIPAPSYERFTPLLQKPANELIEFKLQAQIAQGSQPLVVPSDIFSGRVPHLRRLTLEGLALRFQWSNPIFSSGLTGLSLTDLPERVCILELYNALRAMTGLEFLQVENSLYLVPLSVTTVPASPPPEERISLPKLRWLSIKDYALDVCDFVGHLTIPAFLKIGILMVQRDAHADAAPSVAATARVLAMLSIPRAPQPRQRLWIRHYTTDHFEVRMATPAENGDFREKKDHLNIVFRWKAFNARLERATAFLAILNALPLHAAHELILSSRDPLSNASAQDWAALGSFPSTEIVTLVGHAAYGFVHVLNTPGSLPRLRQLSAQNVHFASPTRSEGLGAALVRRLVKTPLEVLEMRNCNVAEEQVHIFRGFCGEVKREGGANTWGAVGASAAAAVFAPN